MKYDFPIFTNNPGLVYLDSASTTHIPSETIGAINNYLTNNRANIHRGLYSLSSKSTELYEQSLKTISQKIGCKFHQIFQTYNSTYGLNILADLLLSDKYLYSNIFIGQDNHHSAISPFNTRIDKYKNGYNDKYIKQLSLGDDYEYDYRYIKQNTQNNLIIVPYISNVTGVRHNIKKLKSYYPNSQILLDCSQGGLDVNLSDLDVDFAVFTGHKMYSTHCGLVYIKDIEFYKSNIVGGGTIKDVSLINSDIINGQYGFTAGSPDICGLVALAESIKWYEKQKQDLDYEYIYEIIAERYKIIGNPDNNYGIYTINIDKDVTYACMSLGAEDICVRGGGFCAYPLLEEITKREGKANLIRISLGIYNNMGDIYKILQALDNL